MSRRRKRSAPFSLFAFQDIITSVTGIMLVITMLLALELLERTDAAPPRATAAISKDLQQVIATAEREIAGLEPQLQERGKRLVSAAAVSPALLRQQIGELEESIRRQRNLINESRQRDQRTHARVVKARRQQQQSRKREDLLADLLRRSAAKRQQLRKLQQSNRLIFNPAPGNSKSPWLVEVSAARLLVAESGVVGKPLAFSEVDAFLRWARQRDKRSEYFVLLLKPDAIEWFRETRDGLEEAGFEIGFDLLSQGQTVIDSELGAGVQK
jgi:hypothetical protein